ncbi:hypothetical protein SASPL_114831 [Salvia splendens]|uniref:Uncharacterized protein n=1 Tax=Salvia splendens TaxID=180675 RepID=A0A8X8Y6T8_SALSN|nr:hypothetical protein SASPL_114831 [Salvia splendens]
MRNKSWPHWDSWKEIFRKDRDVGVLAKDVIAKMKASQEHTNGYVEGIYHVSLDELYPDEVVAEHVILVQGKESHTHGEKPAQKQTLSKWIGYEFEQSAKRDEVYKLLRLISELTLRQKFYISAKLVKELELLDLFRSMSEEDCPNFVVFMLESDGFI